LLFLGRLKDSDLTREEFKILFDQNFDSIRSYIYYRCGDQDLATDIAQDVFMKVWEKNFDIKGGRIIGLLYKMAGDQYISAYRRKETDNKYRNSITLSYEDENPESTAEYRELKQVYEKALAKMNENQRIVFLMSRVEELKYGEIAERLNIGLKAVEKRMTLALKYLRDEMGVQSKQ
jgi:RNA polymerase sigma-70 factor (ECF subfamily)